jgi:hypothetical protein
MILMTEEEMTFIRTGINRFCMMQRQAASQGINSDMFEIKTKDGALFFSCTTMALLGCNSALNLIESNAQAQYPVMIPRKSWRIIEAFIKFNIIIILNRNLPEYQRRISAGQSKNERLQEYANKQENTLTMLNNLVRKIRKELG